MYCDMRSSRARTRRPPRGERARRERARQLQGGREEHPLPSTAAAAKRAPSERRTRAATASPARRRREEAFRIRSRRLPRARAPQAGADPRKLRPCTGAWEHRASWPGNRDFAKSSREDFAKSSRSRRGAPCAGESDRGASAAHPLASISRYERGRREGRGALHQFTQAGRIASRG